MSDPYGKSRAGQPLRIHATAWNRMLESVGTVPRFDPEDANALDRAANIVLVKNTTNVPVPWLGALGVATPAIGPSTGSLIGTSAADKQAREFVARMVFNGIMPSGGSQAVAVAMEPIAAGKIGRMAIGGLFACKVKVLAESHQYARGRANDVTQLISAECGPVRLVWSEGVVGDNKFGAAMI